MKFWWLTNFNRVSHEKAAVEALAGEGWFTLHRWTVSGGRLAVEGEITADGLAYPVRLLYPDQFPDVPAWVEPQDPQARWSTHQYGAGGALCLELRPDNWSPAATGGDVMRSAYNLLVLESPSGVEASSSRIPSAHNVGEIQTYDLYSSVLMTAGCHKRLCAGIATQVQALRWPLLDEIFPIFVHDAQDRAAPRPPPVADDDMALMELPVVTVVRDAPIAEPTNRTSLIELWELGPEDAQKIETASAAVVVFAGPTDIVAYHVLGDGPPFRRTIRVLPIDAEMRSGRSPQAAEVAVGIVGCGSVGSKLAESVVRSGICSVTLVDGDVLLPANLERHTLDWRDVGYRKVRALKRRLLRLSPGADITIIDQNLNWQRSAETHAWQVTALADCDIIVDATGDTPTSLFLGAIAAANDKPFVSVEVYEGGLGALVASCVPNRSPCYSVARSAFLAWCDAADKAPPRSGTRSYEAFDEGGVPLVADDAAVTMAAAHGARVILDIADGAPADANAAWTLFGFRPGWVFDRHGHTIWLSVGEPSKSSADDVQDAEAKAFALSVLKEAIDARSNRV